MVGQNFTYAVPDLHGADDLLDQGLAAIARHAAPMPDGARTVVFLGDYIDRGAGSRQVIERLMAGPPEGWRWVCLMGNHEDMMVGACNGSADVDHWLDNGGDATLEAYPRVDERWAVPDAHIAWLEALAPMAVDAHRVFVHAGVDPKLPLDAQDARGLLWSRSSNRLGHGGRFVVHGHTPHPEGPATDGQSINLDTYAWNTGRLVIGVFDDDREGGPVDLIEVQRAAGLEQRSRSW